MGDLAPKTGAAGAEAKEGDRKEAEGERMCTWALRKVRERGRAKGQVARACCLPGCLSCQEREDSRDLCPNADLCYTSPAHN